MSRICDGGGSIEEDAGTLLAIDTADRELLPPPPGRIGRPRARRPR